MRSRYRFVDEDGVYFVTSTSVDWIPVFTTPPAFQILIDGKSVMKLDALDG